MQFTKKNNGYWITFPNEHLPHETAEVWAYKGNPQKQSFNDPVGWQTSENVRDYLQQVSQFKS